SDFDEEEYVEAPQRDRLDGEEVDGEHALRLLPQECAPGESAAPACRREACLLEDLPNSSRRHPEAEPVDLACDPLVAPPRILPGAPKHQDTDRSMEGRTPGATAVGPAAGDKSPMPAQQRRRRDHERPPPRPWQQSARRGQERSVGRGELRTFYLAPQHREL